MLPVSNLHSIIYHSHASLLGFLDEFSLHSSFHCPLVGYLSKKTLGNLYRRLTAYLHSKVSQKDFSIDHGVIYLLMIN